MNFWISKRKGESKQAVGSEELAGQALQPNMDFFMRKMRKLEDGKSSKINRIMQSTPAVNRPQLRV